MGRITLILALMLIAGAAVANDDALVRHQYDEQAAAVNNDDAKRLFATISPSFTQVDQTGKTITYTAYKQGLGQLFAGLKSGTMKFKLGPIKYVNGTAIVDYHLEGDLVDRHGEKLHDLEEGRDTWKKVGGKYLQVHEVIKVSKQTPATTAV